MAPKKAALKAKATPRRPRQDLHGDQALMRDIIEWLLDLPAHLREQMERAENCTFSRTNAAPAISAKAAEKSTVLATLDLGSVEATYALVQKGWRPALLNFAHGYNCGGGFDHAHGSQEEDIFRKTSLFLSLWPHRRADDGPGVLKRGKWIGDYDEALPRKDAFYEHTECGAIYSPYVGIAHHRQLRNNAARDSADLHTCAVITAAAQNVGFDPPFNANLLHEKIRTILYLAAANGHDSVVLGAFGCGYFGNPTDVVAETFKKLLTTGGEFEDLFDLVVFAVIGGNRAPFADRFPLLKEKAIPQSTRSDAKSDCAKAKPQPKPQAVTSESTAEVGCSIVSSKDNDVGTTTIEAMTGAGTSRPSAEAMAAEEREDMHFS
jgi:hypothetical protein